MKTVIVVGANGFIGAQLCKDLVRNNIQTYGIARNRKSDTSRLDSIKPSKQFRMIYCDAHDLDSIAGQIENLNTDVMYYLAWQGITGTDRADYKLQLDSISCLLDAVRFAGKIGCKKFVGAGTLAEIDVSNYSGLDGSTPNAVSIYGAAKITAHYMSKALCNQLSMEHVWAYIANTYGEEDKSNNFINYALALMESDKPKDFTSGEQYYDFVHVEDVVQGLRKIGQSGKNNHSYYIGSNRARKLKEYIIEIKEKVDPSIQLNLGAIPFNGKLTPIETYDCEKIRNDTGYRPVISFETGIKRVLEYRERKKNVSDFEFEILELKDAFKIRNFFMEDNRGGFVKCFEKETFMIGGIKFSLDETFVSTSARNVIRGIHFQLSRPQAKLVSVLSGRVLDYIVDLRPESETFKKWICVELSAENHTTLYVPRGFGHGFCSMEDNTLMLYLCDGAYDKKTDTGIKYNDPELNIQWPQLENEIHSDRDLSLMNFQEYMKAPMIWK